MATRKSTTPPAPSFTSDFADSPYRVAYDRESRDYVVVEVETGAELGWFAGTPAGYQDAYRAAAGHNTDAAALALEARAALADEQADRDAETEKRRCPGCDSELTGITVYINGAFRCLVCGCTLQPSDLHTPETDAAEAELDAREAALAARCACFALGIEQPACLARGTSCDREARRVAWLARQEQLRETAHQLGLLHAPVIIPETLHPSPEMPTETYAALWDARSIALAGVAAALKGDAR